jgi:hypothetical protein
VGDEAYRYQTYDERRKAILEQKLLYDPGTTFWYSDLSCVDLQYMHNLLSSTILLLQIS